MKRIALVVLLLVSLAASAWAQPGGGELSVKGVLIPLGILVGIVILVVGLKKISDKWRSQRSNLAITARIGSLADRGVPQDDAEAVKRYGRAAKQGDAEAQLLLGIMCYEGQGVPQDYVQAHLWFSLAAAQGDDTARKKRQIVASEMSLEEIAEARRLAREWKPKTE